MLQGTCKANRLHQSSLYLRRFKKARTQGRMQPPDWLKSPKGAVYECECQRKSGPSGEQEEGKCSSITQLLPNNVQTRYTHSFPTPTGCFRFSADAKASKSNVHIYGLTSVTTGGAWANWSIALNLGPF